MVDTFKGGKWSPCCQWRFQSGWVTQAGNTRGARGRLMGGENPVPPPNCRALDWSVVFTTRQYSGKQ